MTNNKEFINKVLKPSMKPKILATLFFGIIIAIPTFGTTIIPMLLVMAGIALSYAFAQYQITDDNKIIMKYEFINKVKRSIRIDNITNIRYSQNLIERWCKLGSIGFDIFGEGNTLNKSQNNNKKSIITQNKLISIKKSNEIFNTLGDSIKIPEEKNIENQYMAGRGYTNFFSYLFILIFTITTIIMLSIGNTFLKSIPTFPESTSLLYSLVVIFIGLFLIITTYFEVLENNSTRYRIYKNYIEISYKYFYKQSIIRIPYQKITNFDKERNFIRYGVFKLANLVVYTGGSTTTVIKNIRLDSDLADILTYKLKNKSNEEDNKTLSVKGSKISTNSKTTSEKDEELFTSKVSSGYMYKKIISSIIGVLVLMVILFGIFVKLNVNILESENILSYIGGFIFFIFLIQMIGYYILYKSFKYSFYEDKLIITSGLFNVREEVVYFSNIKQVSKKKAYLFDRFLSTNQATIEIMTAGTDTSDVTLHNIELHEQVYEELKEVIIKY